MINKLELFRSLLFTVLVCMLVWDAVLWLADPAHRLPQQHREILLTGFLLWFFSAFVNRNIDDDWAGQF